MNGDMTIFVTGLPIRLNTRDYGHAFGRRVNPKVRSDEWQQSISSTSHIHSVDNQNDLPSCAPVNDSTSACSLSVNNESSSSEGSEDSASMEGLYIYNKSIPSESGKGVCGIFHNSTKLRRNLLILFVVICGCLAIAGITAATTFIAKENHLQPFSDDIQTFSAIVKVNETFDSAMSQSNSKAFQNFGERFCLNVISFVRQNFNDSRCHVDSLSPGSIIVNFTLEISAQKKTHGIQSLLTELLNVSQVGLLTIFPESNNVSYTNDSGKKDFTLNSTTPFNYLPDSLPILPLDYTYPGYCGDYQVWSNGIFVLEKCPEGEEFAYLSLNDVSICAPPSSSTYCGKKREENVTSKPEKSHTTTVKTTSSSEPPPSTFSSSMMLYKTTASLTTYPMQNTATDVSTPKTPTTLKSPGEDTLTYFTSPTSTPGTPTTSTFSKQGLTSLATVTASATSEKYVSSPFSSTTTLTTTEWKPVYTCPSTGYAYLPTHDTYPDNCAKHQWCQHGVSTIKTCALGTDFVYSNIPSDEVACDHFYSPLTFCNKMKALSSTVTPS